MRKIDPDQQRRAYGFRSRPAVLALSQRAFTLIELTVGLAVAAILLGAAAPSMISLRARLELRSAAEDLVSAIHTTRAMAIAHGRIVALLPLGQDGSDWREGWQIIIDSNGNRRADPGELQFFRHRPVGDGIHIHSALTDGALPSYIAYNAAGRSCKAGNSLAANWGTLTLEHGEQRRNIKINMLGRVRLCDPAGKAAGCTGAAE